MGSPIIVQVESAAEQRQTRAALLWIGVLFLVLGVAVFMYGLAAAHAHLRCEARVTGLAVPAARACIEIELWPFTVGGLVAVFGALLIQFRDVGKAASVVRENVPVLGMLGGRRITDKVAAAVVAERATAPAPVPPSAPGALMPLPPMLAAQDERGEEDERGDADGDGIPDMMDPTPRGDR